MAENNQISEKLKSARTMEDIVNLLSILFTNLNNQSEQYYDMFWNPEPMDLYLEKYDENGKLEVVPHPNVAKMRLFVDSGPGDPNGVKEATIGALYINTLTTDLYYKATGTDAYGWQKIWSSANLVVARDYLAPNGDGSQLQNLNANSINQGTLPVKYGGTGVNSITGIIKGNGDAPFEAAIPEVDYMTPTSFTGLIMTCPLEVIPDGWLICDGVIYDITLRPELTRLCNKLGNKYGGNGVTTFGVPNLMNRYVKYGPLESVGVVEDGHIGEHTHTASATTAGAHRHGIAPKKAGGSAGTSGNYGSTRIYGTFLTKNDNEPFTNADGVKSQTGALRIPNSDIYETFIDGSGSKKYKKYKSNYGGQSTASGGGFLGVLLNTDMNGSWSGSMSTEGTHTHPITVNKAGSGTNDVDHIIMVPIIRY